jgi:hypothetical protein
MLKSPALLLSVTHKLVRATDPEFNSALTHSWIGNSRDTIDSSLQTWLPNDSSPALGNTEQQLGDLIEPSKDASQKAQIVAKFRNDHNIVTGREAPLIQEQISRDLITARAQLAALHGRYDIARNQRPRDAGCGARLADHQSAARAAAGANRCAAREAASRRLTLSSASSRVGMPLGWPAGRSVRLSLWGSRCITSRMSACPRRTSAKPAPLTLLAACIIHPERTSRTAALTIRPWVG